MPAPGLERPDVLHILFVTETVTAAIYQGAKISENKTQTK